VRQNNGKSWLINRMEEVGVSTNHLAWGMSVSRRLVQHWREGRPPSEAQLREIDLFLSGRRECHKGQAPYAHPHRRFLQDLERAIGGGLNFEVLGLPGMLKSAVLSDLDCRLRGDDGERKHFYFHDLGEKSDIDQFWNSLGRHIIGGDRQRFTFQEVKEAMREKTWTLLLDDADLFLSNVEQKYSDKPHEFRPIGSQWIKNVLGLPGSKILTSTIASADFVALVAEGSPCVFPKQELNQWYSETDWNFWTAVLADNPRNDVQELKKMAKGIPLVFREGLNNLKAKRYDNAADAVREVQDNIARSIWARLPAKRREDLKKANFELSNQSTLFEAFFKSGITRNKMGSLQNALRVPGWLTTWKALARSTI
jgi:hypothetical protein